MDIESGVELLFENGNSIIIRLLLSESLISPEMLKRCAKKSFQRHFMPSDNLNELLLLLHEFEILDTDLATQIMECLDDIIGFHDCEYPYTPMDILNILIEYGANVNDNLIVKMETKDLVDYVTSSGKLIDFNLETQFLRAWNTSPDTIKWIRKNSCEQYDVMESLVLFMCTHSVKLFPLYYEYIEHDHELIDKAIYSMVIARDCFGRNECMNHIPTIPNHIINDELAFFLYLHFPRTSIFPSDTIQKIFHLLPTKVIDYITLSIADNVLNCPETKMLYDRTANCQYCDLIDIMKKISEYVDVNFL